MSNFLKKIISSLILLIVVLLIFIPSSLVVIKLLLLSWIFYYLIVELISLKNEDTNKKEISLNPFYDHKILYQYGPFLSFFWISISYYLNLNYYLGLMILLLCFKKIRFYIFYLFIPMFYLKMVALDIKVDFLLYFFPFIISQICDWSGFLTGNILKIYNKKTHQLSKISPSKTIEGAIAGVLISTLVSFYFLQNYHLTYSILLSCCSLVAISGDLFESSLKRKFKVKDSGYILKDHGGMLDRLDSWLFVSYIGYIIIFLRNFL